MHPKELVKLGAFGVSSALVSPLILGAWLETRFRKGESFFQGSSQLVALIPFKFGVYVRSAFYANVCACVNRETTIGFLTLLSHTDTTLGRHVYIGPQSNIGTCTIENDCLLGSGVHILSGKRQHDFSHHERPIRLQGGVYEKIEIGENCWIGNHATVMANIGAHSIIAAGAVVVDDIPPYAIAVGNPARVLRKR